MKCYVVQDLMPEYIEGLCQEETAKEMEAHLQECPECAGKWEMMKQSEQEEPRELEMENIHPFQKIKREIKKNKIKKVVAVVLLILVCLVFGTLTLGQIFPTLDCPSYDSLMYRHQAKEVAKKFVEGDMEAVIAGMGIDVNSQQYSTQKTFYNDTVARLKKFHKDIFQGEKTKIHLNNIVYEEPVSMSESYLDLSEEYIAQVEIQCGERELFLEIWFGNRNNYRLEVYTGEYSYFGGDELTQEQMQDKFKVAICQMNALLSFYKDASRQDNIQKYILEQRISHIVQEDIDQIQDMTFYVYDLVEDCNAIPVRASANGVSEFDKIMGQKVKDILRRCKKNSFQFGEGFYDGQKKAFQAKLYWEVEDLKGKKALMTQDFYYGPMGYEPVPNTSFVYGEEGVDTELLEKLQAGF